MTLIFRALSVASGAIFTSRVTRADLADAWRGARAIRIIIAVFTAQLMLFVLALIAAHGLAGAR